MTRLIIAFAIFAAAVAPATALAETTPTQQACSAASAASNFYAQIGPCTSAAQEYIAHAETVTGDEHYMDLGMAAYALKAAALASYLTGLRPVVARLQMEQARSYLTDVLTHLPMTKADRRIVKTNLEQTNYWLKHPPRKVE